MKPMLARSPGLNAWLAPGDGHGTEAREALPDPAGPPVSGATEQSSGHEANRRPRSLPS